MSHPNPGSCSSEMENFVVSYSIMMNVQIETHIDELELMGRSSKK